MILHIFISLFLCAPMYAADVKVPDKSANIAGIYVYNRSKQRAATLVGKYHSPSGISTTEVHIPAAIHEKIAFGKQRDIVRHAFFPLYHDEEQKKILKLITTLDNPRLSVSASIDVTPLLPILLYHPTEQTVSFSLDCRPCKDFYLYKFFEPFSRKKLLEESMATDSYKKAQATEGKV